MFSYSLAIASDHAGTLLKQSLIERLLNHGHQVQDLSETPDYPDSAHKLIQEMLDNHIEKGILICGTGIGMSIAANRHGGIRAAVCHDITCTRLARQHNNINVLALGARLIGLEVAWDCVMTFLQTPFSDEVRHSRRIAKIESKLETKIANTSFLTLKD